VLLPRQRNHLPMGPAGDPPPGNPRGRWVYCSKCGQTSRKRGAQSSGCPVPGCEGGPDDIKTVRQPAGDR